MITRRALPFAAAASATLPALLRGRGAMAALPIPPSNSIKARVMRNGSDIGTATYQFDRQGDNLSVRVAVDLVVKFGPVAVFRYTHRNLETWHGDTLVGLDAKTDDDGTPKFCRATRGPEGLTVIGSRENKSYVAPPDALGTTYWNFKTVSVPLINTEDGHLLGIKIAPTGQKSVELATGTPVQAREFIMTGDLHLELFYEANNEWAAMNYYAKDKSVVNYQRF